MAPTSDRPVHSPTRATTLQGFTLVCTYQYLTGESKYAFGKQRWERLDPITGSRSKTFRYWDPYERRQRKPEGADDLLYRLPEVLAGIQDRRTVHWAEGEKDADALVKAGEIATSHHQGAGRVTLQQAAWLSDARQIVLWVDKDVDHWDVGAYDAVLRHNLLIDVGVPARRIRFVRARGVGRKDAFDHLLAFSPSRAVAVDKYKLADVAAAYTPASSARTGYAHV